ARTTAEKNALKAEDHAKRKTLEAEEAIKARTTAEKNALKAEDHAKRKTLEAEEAIKARTKAEKKTREVEKETKKTILKAEEHAKKETLEVEELLTQARDDLEETRHNLETALETHQVLQNQLSDAEGENQVWREWRAAFDRRFPIRFYRIFQRLLGRP
ncbi:MAG: hypothetical protein DRH08_14800, partial [Deltaproteobacteria bacterium]